MRSCAFRILEAATISIALVIFRVFCTLRIFIRISFVPGICQFLDPPPLRGSPPWQGAKRQKRPPFFPSFVPALSPLSSSAGGALLSFHGFPHHPELFFILSRLHFFADKGLLTSV